jgi:hypothetical protein
MAIIRTDWDTSRDKVTLKGKRPAKKKGKPKK